MENSSRLFAEVASMPGPPDRVSQLREEWRMTRAALMELQRIGMPRVNLLLIGTAGVIHNVLELLVLELRPPVITWRRGERLALPSVTQAGTMILNDVGTLAYEDQHRLLDWLERSAGRTQVVSTATAPLLPHVQAGTFVDTLYYRLNTVCVDVTN